MDNRVGTGERMWQWLSMVVVAVAIGGVGHFAYRYMTDNPVIAYNASPFEVDKESYSIGDTVAVDIQVCADTSVQYRVTKYLRNTDTDEIFYLEDNTISAIEGCLTVKCTPATITDEIPPGRYIIVFRIYVPGFYQEHVIAKHTHSFEITE